MLRQFQDAGACKHKKLNIRCRFVGHAARTCHITNDLVTLMNCVSIWFCLKTMAQITEAVVTGMIQLQSMVCWFQISLSIFLNSASMLYFVSNGLMPVPIHVPATLFLSNTFTFGAISDLQEYEYRHSCFVGGWHQQLSVGSHLLFTSLWPGTALSFCVEIVLHLFVSDLQTLFRLRHGLSSRMRTPGRCVSAEQLIIGLWATTMVLLVPCATWVA